MTISISRNSQNQKPVNCGLNAVNYQSKNRISRIETPEDRRRREIQDQTMELQRIHLQKILLRRLYKAEQRGDASLICELRKEWHELFPYETSIGE